jgi:putative pyruvate formate lyase activating enzyme
VQQSCNKLFKTGELSKRVEKAYQVLQDCTLCPHHCRVDRTKGEKGYCRTGSEIRVASYGPHFGEEPPLVGERGSGTIFFSNCNLRCVYCQNYDISYKGEGEEVSIKELAEIMLSLQKEGCHNINFVTPSHMIHAVLAATEEACKMGLKIPLIYNSGGYDDVEALKLLDGIIDIYMPDIKYADEVIALRYSKIPDYFRIVKKALKEMHHQVGDLKIHDGIAERGLIIRHLVLPDKMAGTEEIMEFIASEISSNTFVNIMEQYYPAFRAEEYSSLKRKITSKEYREALKLAKEAGLKRILY